jgi:putative transposase
MKYRFISDHRNEFNILRMCRVLEVKRVSYYEWQRRSPSKRTIENLRLLLEIKSIYKKSGETYGSPKIWKEMLRNGIRCSHKRIARLMKANNIRSIVQKKYRKKGRVVNEEEASMNILNREFNPKEANKAWATDITYIPTKSGWCYSCVVIDLYSKKVVGYSASSSMTTELVLEALDMAIRRRNPGKGLLIHSDRGSQFGSIKFRKKLKSHEFVQSMSRKGNCWDNACIESFFHLLKSERLNHYRFNNVAQVRWELFKYIDGFYNTIRIHSSLGYLSPAEFENKKSA